ncbi:MAG: carboxymuconolactone decarboxylase family protein [Planctomycetes bacterium]|nr:carboxymuconolactone decarboxylase family protein [Planctomycetota bacterium]
MSILTTIDPASATGAAKEIFDGPLKGKHFNIFKAMANSPAALQAYLGFSGALSKGVFTAKEVEVIHLALGEARSCDYCVAAHTAIGKGAGLTEGQTIEARRGALADKKLDALAKFVLILDEKKGHASAKDVADFRNAGFTDAHVVEAVAQLALATYTNYFNHVNQTAVDFPAAPKI